MSQIFELFGYRIADKSEHAELHRRKAFCPFMNRDCDGGGNRHLSKVDLSRNDSLREYFFQRPNVQSGICSLELRAGSRPWIVCPRRLLYLGTHHSPQQEATRALLCNNSGYEPGTHLGVWPEVKLKFKENGGKSFDYTFDYILCPIGNATPAQAERATGEKWPTVQKWLNEAGYERPSNDEIKDFPIGPPLIVEVMTSSTSGGNKRKRTTIPLAFQEAISGQSHEGPSINKRQVWARMASQLVVKSEVALAWGGKTFWVLQDTLVDYISQSTALDLQVFLSANASEVNIISVASDTTEGLQIKKVDLLAGPIRPPDSQSKEPCFQDIIRAPTIPPLSRLMRLLVRRKFTGIISV